MNVTDYFIMLLHLPLPYDVIRHIFEFCRYDIMKKINYEYICQRVRSCPHINIRYLPYSIFTMKDIYKIMQTYMIENELRIAFTHYNKYTKKYEGCIFYPIADLS